MGSNQLEQCRCCPRLVDHLAALRQDYPEYHNRPVPAIGAASARALIVGLAPGMHGANATGIPFNGDASGAFLFAALERYGLAQPNPTKTAWQLQGLRITNAVKCLPPNNRPNADEFKRCSVFLKQEIESIPPGGAILALGHLAHRAVLRALSLSPADYPFKHGVRYRKPGSHVLLCSYHCSRYNTQTGRLTASMFDAVIEQLSRFMIKK